MKKVVQVGVKAKILSQNNKPNGGRKMKKALPTNKALELNLKRLEDYAKQSKLDINKYLEEVIIRGWLAFYPIENKTKQEPVREERPWL